MTIHVPLTREEILALNRTANYYEANPDLEDGVEEYEGKAIDDDRNIHDEIYSHLESVRSKLNKSLNDLE